jgi:hypothetical protein
MDNVYYLEIEDGDGLTQVSLVQSPAIEEDFHFFSAQKDPLAFAIESEERRLITGPAMIAEKPIMRRSESGETYYVKFSKDTIRKAVKLWALQNKYNAVNAEHANPVGGVYLMESWVTDESRGIAAPKAWSDAADGSWFLTYYVENDQVWQDVKDGKFRGFSIEGYFTDKPAQAEEETMSAIAAILAKCDNLKFETLSEMSAINKLNEIKKLLGFSVEEDAPASEVKFAESTLVDGTVIRFPGEEIAMLGVGSVLEVQTPEGDFVPAPDGTHETAEGYLVTTEGGIVTEIVEKAQEEAPAEEMEVDQFAAIREEYSAKFAEQQTAIEKLTAAIERLTNAQAKTVEVIEQFSAIPAAEPVKKVNGLRGEAARRDEQLEKFAAAIRNIKNAK